MYIFLRFLPYLAGLTQVAVFWLQKKTPELYPWIILFGVLLIPFSAVLLVYKKNVSWSDLIEKVIPVFLMIASLAFGLLLAESDLEFYIMLFLAASATMVSLKLLFLFAHQPELYPVSGLSHVNIAYVPIIVWYAASTSSGLMTFIHSSGLWHVLMMVALGMILYRTTGHPGATREQNAIWLIVGALLGLEIGLLGLYLPISMKMQGFIAAMAFTGALRVRRYLYKPVPSRRTAVLEIVLGSVLFVSCLLTTKWL